MLEPGLWCLLFRFWLASETCRDVGSAFGDDIDGKVNWLQYPIPMSGDTQGRTEQYIGNWLKTMPRDKVWKIVYDGKRKNCDES